MQTPASSSTPCTLPTINPPNFYDVAGPSKIPPKPPLNLKPAWGKKSLFSNIQQMRVQIMEEERAERSVHEELFFKAQMKEIEERREYACKLFLEEENI